MSKNIRSRFVFIFALIRSFVNDVIRKQKVEAKAVPPEGVYRQGNYPAPTPLWRTWWAEKRVAMKSFWPWARRVGKTLSKVFAICSVPAAFVLILVFSWNQDKQAEAVITRVRWACNGYIEIEDGKNTVYYRSKAFQGEGLAAKCPPGPSGDWRAEGTLMYRVTFWVDLTYPRGGYANEQVSFSWDDAANESHTLRQTYQPGTHWKVRRERRFFQNRGTKLVHALPQPVKGVK